MALTEGTCISLVSDSAIRRLFRKNEAIIKFFGCSIVFLNFTVKGSESMSIPGGNISFGGGVGNILKNAATAASKSLDPSLLEKLGKAVLKLLGFPC